MAEKGAYRRTRLRNAVLAGCISLGIAALADLDVPTKVIAAVLGSAGGIYWGECTWGRLLKRLGQGDRLVVYFTDTPAYPVLLLVCLFSFLSLFGGLMMAWRVYRYSEVVQLFCLLVGFAWAGHDFQIWQRLYRFESSQGALRVRSFYSPSVIGTEGMIGREGVVEISEGPQGKVVIDGERWFFNSGDGLEIKMGAEVEVSDMEGLTLIVRQKGSGE